MSQLTSQQISALLRVVQSPEERFNSSRTLKAFREDFNLGRRRGASLVFDCADKAHIRAILHAEGIDPETPRSAWQGLTRAEALQLGPNEKCTRAAVKRQRVAIKTLPGRPIRWDDRDIHLPLGGHLDANAEVAGAALRHESAILVENWECFERIHDIDLDLSVAGANPVIVWRGDASSTRTDHALTLLRQLKCPVWAFVDFDPAGLLIAYRTPGFAGLIAPSWERLQRDLSQGLADRYQEQLPQTNQTLDACENADIQRFWALLRQFGRALPQERYISNAPLI